MSQKRLQMVHIAWLALVAGCTLAGLIAGAPAAHALLAGLVAAIPGLSGAFLPAGHVAGRGLVVVSWSVLSVLALAVTGGAGSPLSVWLVAAPVMALTTGQNRMAAEAGLFAVLALLLVLVTDTAGRLPDPPQWASLMTALYAFAGLVLITLTICLMVAGGPGTAGPVPGLAGKAVSPPPGQERMPQTALLPQPAMPSRMAALIEVTPQGRLRSVAGDCFGLGRLRAGAALASLFEPGGLTEEIGTAGWQGVFQARLVSGQDVLLAGETAEDGSRLLLLAAPQASPAAVEEMRAGFDAELRQRTAFFASLGHDLRTPLHAILGYAEIMQAGLMGPMPEAYADYPAIIHESGTDLLLLVDDILDLARSEAGEPRLDPEPVDLTASAESVIRQLAGHAHRAGVTLRLKADGAVWAQADARAVRQIWQNLVSNAIKYSPTGKTITLETVLLDGAAVLRVQDRGKGIKGEDLARLTQPFVQAAGARPGTGLGLSVVRRFAELHGGELRLSSSPGRGTRAEVRLPRASESDLDSPGDAAMDEV